MEIKMYFFNDYERCVVCLPEDTQLHCWQYTISRPKQSRTAYKTACQKDEGIQLFKNNQLQSYTN